MAFSPANGRQVPAQVATDKHSNHVGLVDNHDRLGVNSTFSNSDSRGHSAYRQDLYSVGTLCFCLRIGGMAPRQVESPMHCERADCGWVGDCPLRFIRNWTSPVCGNLAGSDNLRLLDLDALQAPFGRTVVTWICGRGSLATAARIRPGASPRRRPGGYGTCHRVDPIARPGTRICCTVKSIPSFATFSGNDPPDDSHFYWD